ncbi:hypothetical protein HL669_03890 [Vibrio parahaemolyticus]|uniref:hypothetical protein n=1 Tax=Vibrio parahaemolyticus TaxID=670 RepID=UPI0014852E53|nr:hypothetical protein [Vibrio parahaemolyticus]NNU10755.1 hypothetical protein [Vibrio parahaemolyticus]QQE18340.1 hypothetical protein JCT83_16065 [Vibrio parahaemolyticus]
MIKNWTVTTQPVRLASDGIMMRERYLLNTKHANHKYTEALVSLFGCAETSNRIALAGEQFRLNQQLYNHKGGRPLSSYAIEYCLTLPKGYRPSIEQWQSIVKDCCLTLAKHCKLNKSEFAQYRQQIRAVLHQQKQATKIIKQAFNQSVLKYVGIDHRTYEPIEKEKGRRLSTWQYQHQKATEAFEIEKLIKQMQVQFDKWLKAKETHDERQLKRQKNRLLKTYEELKIKNTSPTQIENINKIKNEII